MQDAIDLDDLCADAVNRQKGKAGEYQLARSCLAARTPTIWESGERIYALTDRSRYAARGTRTFMFLNVVTDVGEVLGRQLCPSNPHQPG